jgi:hypothetical protein
VLRKVIGATSTDETERVILHRLGLWLGTLRTDHAGLRSESEAANVVNNCGLALSGTANLLGVDLRRDVHFMLLSVCW